MRTASQLASLGFALVVALSSPVLAQEKAKVKPFTDSTEVVLSNILPAPPANDSLKTKQEIGEVLTLQVTRTPDMEARAKADAVEDIWRFSEVVNNPKFTKENLPKFAAFFDRIVATEPAVTDAAKDNWKRPRPHLLYPELVKPIVSLSKSGSYPSGHTTVGTLLATELANMLPEKRDAIMARGWEYGWNRVVAGIHYATDIEAGRLSAVAIAQTIATHDDFKAEFDAAKTEVRAALGM